MAEQDKNKTPAKKKAEKPAKAKKPGFFQRIGKWFRELRSETKKVVWPTKKQVVNNTLIVLFMVLIVTLFVWLLDLGFGALVRLVTSVLS